MSYFFLQIYRNLTLACIRGEVQDICVSIRQCIVALWFSMFIFTKQCNVCILMDIYDGQNGLIYALWWVMMTLTFYCTLTLTQWAWLDYFSKWVSSWNWIYFWVKRISMMLSYNSETATEIYCKRQTFMYTCSNYVLKKCTAISLLHHRVNLIPKSCPETKKKVTLHCMCHDIQKKRLYVIVLYKRRIGDTNFHNTLNLWFIGHVTASPRRGPFQSVYQIHKTFIHLN